MDAGSIRIYFYQNGSDPDGKIQAGPVCDYDLTMRNTATWQTKAVEAFFADKAHIWNLENFTWYYGLNQKPEFQRRVQEVL